MSQLIMGSTQLGLIYAIMGLGIYVSFRILDIPDLTVDGSFTLGMSVSAVLTISGHPILGVIGAGAAGAVAGITTGFLQTKVGIHAILSGILTMTGLYTVNMFIMGGKSNLSLVGGDTIFTDFQLITGLEPNISKLVLCIILCIISLIALAIFFKTRMGITVRATGDNEEMVRASSINADFTKCFGFALGNAFVAFSGAIICQYQMFSDISYGTGIVVIGLASIIIGEAFFGKRGVTIGLIATASGSVVYRIIIALALKVRLFPAYGLKLISAVIVAVALSLPTVKSYCRSRKIRKEAGKNGIQ